MERWKQIMLAGLAAMGIWMIGGAQAEAAVPIDEANFPDPTVQAHVKVYDKNNDGVLSDEELKIPTQFGRWFAGMPEEYIFHVKSGAIVDFKGMEHFPNIKELDFGVLGDDKKKNWNYGGSDLLQCFPYAEIISLSGLYDGEKMQGQVILSGKSDCLRKVEINAASLTVKWNVQAKNLKYIDIDAYEVDGIQNSQGEMPSLERLKLKCQKMQNCDLALAKMPLLKDLCLRSNKIFERDLRKNGVFLEELWKLKLETLEIDIDLKDYGFLSGLKDLKKLVLIGDLPGKNFSLKGLSSLEELNLQNAWFNQLNLNPVKKTLKTLFVGSPEGLGYASSWIDYGNPGFKTLDISQMECLETLYGSNTSIKKIITKDDSGKSAVKKLRKVRLWHSKVQSIRVEDMPALEELFLEGSFSKLNTKKSKKLKSLYLKSDQLKSLDLRKNVMLDILHIRGMKKVKKLDLSRNTSLRSLHFGSKMKLKKLTLPALKDLKISMTNYHKRCKVDVLDLSRLKKMDTKIRGKYLHAFQFKKGYKQVIISKKLKKSHRNWFKKKAKKVKAKVIVR